MNRATEQLLFGMMALQNGFVTKENLLSVFSIWILDKSVLIQDLLVDRKFLSEPTRDVLAALVSEHLRQHGNDPERSLAAMGDQADLGTELEQMPDPDLFATLVAVRKTDDTGDSATDAYATLPAVSNSANPRARFEVLRHHAAGGLGIVSIAFDRELNRQVALKEIRTERANDLDSRTRFVKEAEITGQLEHPGIVPVYGLGAYSDGRPYYAMRFVEGENLSSAIRSFHKNRTTNERISGQRAVRFRSLLAKFVTICQAIDYAHSRGVLHRDIKPDNILLGPYGETLVVDWGLAKTIESENASESLKSNRASDSAPIKVRGSSSSGTLDGSAVGTPGFISPEQAMGRIAMLGPATDIYGLGATLYAILTGKAPVSGANANEILEKSKRGELDSVSQHWSSVPTALSEICMKAMSFDESQRYNTCRELAVDVERWLADEPVLAHRETMAELASRFVRKHQTIVTSGAVLLLASTALLSASIWFAARLEGERQTTQYKELEVFSERRNVREQEFFAKVNAIRERSTKCLPGWSWVNEKELQQISALASTEDGYRVLREETARLATTPDIRKIGTIANGLKVRVFAWSSDGKLLALGQRTATALSLQVRLFKADTFELVKTISFQQSFANVFPKMETDGITSLAFSPDSQQLLIGTRAGEMHKYELDRFTRVARWSAHESAINCICISPDGTILITGSNDAKLKWWSLQNQRLLRTEATGPVRLLYSAEKTVYSFSDKVETYPIDPNDSTKHAIPHISSTGAVATVQDIGFLSVGESGLEQYSINGRLQRKLIGSRRNDQSADAIEIGCFGQYAIVNYLKSCDVWDVVAGRKIASINGEQVFSAVVDPRQPRIVVADNEHVDWYEIRQDAAWKSLPLHESAIAKACVASTANQIITSFTSNDSEKPNRIRKWQLAPIQLLDEVSLPPVDLSKVTASHDGTSVAFISRDSSTLCEMDIASQSMRELFPTAMNSKSIVYSDDDQQVWFDSINIDSSSFAKLDAWAIVGLERQSKKQIFRSKNQSSQILKGYSHFCDLRIGKRYILASTNDTINLWDVNSNFEARPGPKVTDIPDKLALFTSEAQGVAGTGVGGLMIFDTSSGEEVARTQAHLSRITALSTIGNHLVFAGDSFGEISIWHWNDKKLDLLCRLGPFSDSVNGIAAIGSSNLILVHFNGEPTVRILNWKEIVARWNQLDLLAGRELVVPQKDGSSQSFDKFH